MDFKIPIKKSKLYTEFYGLKIEPSLKREIKELASLDGEDAPDVPEAIRMAIREAVKKVKEDRGLLKPAS